MNKRLVPEADTIFMPTTEHYSYVSSSLIREIASLGGDVREFVHPIVHSALTERLGKRTKK
jgi:pantetheine-phosphate adenylyltransferase